MCACYKMTFHVNFMLIHCFNLTMKNISLAMKYLGHNPEYTTVYIKALCLFILPSKYINQNILRLAFQTSFTQWYHQRTTWWLDREGNLRPMYFQSGVLPLNIHIFFALYNDEDKPWHKKHQQKKQINKIEQFLLNTNQQTCSS